MLYLYAFVPRITTPPAILGIAGRELELVPLGTVAALVSEVDGAIDPEEENILAHARVIDALAAEHDAVLPVRFGRGGREATDEDPSHPR